MFHSNKRSMCLYITTCHNSKYHISYEYPEHCYKKLEMAKKLFLIFTFLLIYGIKVDWFYA